MNVEAKIIKIENGGSPTKIEFERVFDAISFFNKYNPACHEFKISLYIKYEEEFEIYGEKSLTTHVKNR